MINNTGEAACARDESCAYLHFMDLHLSAKRNVFVFLFFPMSFTLAGLPTGVLDFTEMLSDLCNWAGQWACGSSVCLNSYSVLFRPASDLDTSWSFSSGQNMGFLGLRDSIFKLKSLFLTFFQVSEKTLKVGRAQTVPGTSPLFTSFIYKQLLQADTKCHSIFTCSESSHLQIVQFLAKGIHVLVKCRLITFFLSKSLLF